LVAPLNWGLGHATRCIPIIKELVRAGVEVIIAADGRPLKLLKQEFPNLHYISLPGYNLLYTGKRTMGFQIFLGTPKIFWEIFKEHQALKSIIRENNIDAVISDNRYGMWNQNVRSIFITHQVMIKCSSRLRFLEPLLRAITGFFIKKYDECWVPDHEGKDNFSGDLSHKYKYSNMRYVGPISRFLGKKSKKSRQYDLLVSLSGPEPQRTIFEKLVLSQLKQNKLKTIVVNGTLDSDILESQNGLIFHSHLETEEMEEAMSDSKLVLSRPGYSTIMDLAVTGNKAIFVPTPGQTEQEYLANRLEAKGLFYHEDQSGFDLKRALKRAIAYKGFSEFEETDCMKTVVANLAKGL